MPENTVELKGFYRLAWFKHNRKLTMLYNNAFDIPENDSVDNTKFALMGKNPDTPMRLEDIDTFTFDLNNPSHVATIHSYIDTTKDRNRIVEVDVDANGNYSSLFISPARPEGARYVNYNEETRSWEVHPHDQLLTSRDTAQETVDRIKNEINDAEAKAIRPSQSILNCYIAGITPDTEDVTRLLEHENLKKAKRIELTTATQQLNDIMTQINNL